LKHFEKLMKFSKTFLILTVLFLLTAVITIRPEQAIQAAEPAAYEPGQVIVKLASSPLLTILDINLTYGTSTITSLTGLNKVYLLQAPPGITAGQLVQLMAGDTRLVYAELNHIHTTPEDSSTNRTYGWGESADPGPYTQNGDWAAAQAISQGEGVIVAVLDSGIQWDHPAFANRLDPFSFDFIDGDTWPNEEADGLDNDDDGLIDESYGHGTHVAGIVHLAAPASQLMILRVLDTDGRGNDFRTADAILYAAAHDAQVINLSLGTSVPSITLREAVKQAAEMGVVVVAAAGNMDNSDPQYPAAELCTLAVTSADSEGYKSDFASYGSWIDVVAIGENIYSTFPENNYAWWSGTSMSTPFVSGQAALLLGHSANLSLNQIGRLIGGTADSLDALNPAYAGLLGKGQIDVLSSLNALTNNGRPPQGGNLFAGCLD
jgi:subtilisin family serine protease